MNHLEKRSSAARGLIAIRSLSVLVSQASQSIPSSGNDPILGRNQLLRKSRSYCRGRSNLDRETCFRTALSSQYYVLIRGEFLATVY